ncbi:hypothetical protein EDC04DRAFT_2609831 [Pisolithus marmoratus]|nr:hypothetical protein EDC04DRAFT_2609831 [Pisolithus marmoratus]
MNLYISFLSARPPYCARTRSAAPEKLLLVYGADNSKPGQEPDNLSNAANRPRSEYVMKQVYDESNEGEEDEKCKLCDQIQCDEAKSSLLVVVFPTHQQDGESSFVRRTHEWFLFREDAVRLFPETMRGLHLYFIPETQGSMGTISILAPYEGSLASPLYALLKDPTILPEGGHLTFGLRRTDVALVRVLTSPGLVWNVLAFYWKVGSYGNYIDESEMGELYASLSDFQEPAQRVVRKVDSVEVSTWIDTWKERKQQSQNELHSYATRNLRQAMSYSGEGAPTGLSWHDTSRPIDRVPHHSDRFQAPVVNEGRVLEAPPPSP